VQDGLGFFEIREGVNAFGTTFDLADGLRAAKHQDAEDGILAAAKVKLLGKPLSEFRHTATAGDDCGKAAHAQRLQPALYVAFGVFGDWPPVRLLIACRDEAVERHRIILGRSGLLFDQGAKDAEFNRTEDVIHLNQSNTDAGAGRASAVDSIPLFAYLEGMEVHFTQEQETQLSQLAIHSGTDAERLVKDAALRLLGEETRFRKAVREGIAQADRGEFIEEEEMDARLEEMLRS
jgi:predicted transcriptional regulator